MEFIQLVDLMGQAPDEPKLRQHLVDAGITQQPRPPEGEDSAYAQFAEQGYEMRFDVDPDDNTRMFLRAITAFPKGGGAYKPFTGKLPLDMAPGESRAQLLTRLGPPAIRNENFNIDMWKLGALYVVVNYDKADSTVSKIQVNVPKK